FTLSYAAVVPVGDPSNFGGVNYTVNAGGHVVVPVPAAAWLFGSGLVGLVGVARRRKA
ncbi:MAG TPA: VPLPA-CTERM sorting domain-containing protein, partial [Gammaproteobacteria bacterium]|nr:VPLPA-CTERM sorting domain-containing protein [Gammaproteobacteria bacterium]